MRANLYNQLLAGLLLSIASLQPTAAMEKPYPGVFFENEQLLMVVIVRTPEQMAAFYEARGFPQRAIDEVTATCFATVHIKNRSDEITWLETDNWRITAAGKPLTIIGEQAWNASWDRIDLPLANRSTFRWTQLPPVVDLHPDEPVGGNIVLPGDTTRFDIEANFRTGADRSGPPRQVIFRDIDCTEVPTAP